MSLHFCQPHRPRTWFLRTDRLGEVALALAVLPTLRERPLVSGMSRIGSRTAA